MILLTEAGMYRLIFISRCDMASEFKKYMFNLIRETRIREREQLRVVSQYDYKTLLALHTQLKQKLSEYERFNPAIYVFECSMNSGDDPYLHMLPADRDKELIESTKLLPPGDGSAKLYKF